MDSELVVPLRELNVSYHNKPVTCQGIVAELSSEYYDNRFGQIQIAYLHSLKGDNRRLGIQWGIDIILQEELTGVVYLGDKVEVTGSLVVYETHICRPRNLAILAKKIKIINNEAYTEITEQDFKYFRMLSKTPFLHEKLANYLFDNLSIDGEIKLIGLLTTFINDTPILIDYKIHNKISILIIGPSGTYKTPYLRKFEEKLAFMTARFSQKSDVQFLSSKSRYKIGGEQCLISGLTEFAKDGIILIDNIEEIKANKLADLEKNFTEILEKASIIAAVHSKDKKFSNKVPITRNLQFPKKSNLLGKFDLVLFSNIHFDDLTDDYIEKKLLNPTEENNIPFMTNKFFRKYLSYSKKEFDPLFENDSVVNMIHEFKEEVVKLNSEKKSFKKIDPKNLIRVIMLLCKSYARISLRGDIIASDVQKVIQIYRKSLIYLDLI